MTERRRHPRVSVDVPVTLTSADGTTLEGHLRDLSIDAVLVDTATNWPLGTAVSLELTLPGDNAPLRVPGTVIRHANGEGANPGMAVLFSDLPPNAATRIDLYLDRHDRS